MLNDLAWFLFFRRQRRAVRRFFLLLFVLLFLGALVYTAIVFQAVLERMH
jgi:hypothetical protein